MSTQVDRFTAEHFTLNSISPQRQTQVSAALVLLTGWLGKPAEQATASDLRSWLVSLLEEGRKPSTVGWYLSMVRPFYRWCWREQLIGADDWMRIDEVAPPRGHASGQPRPYSRKELGQMWADLDAKFPYAPEHTVQLWRRGGRVAWRRIRKHAMRRQLDAIIELALVCGLRRNEIYSLSVDDVHPDNKYIVVHGKRVDHTDKVREVSYPDSAREAVREWFKVRAWLSPEPGLPIWLSITGRTRAGGLSRDRMATILHSFGEPWTLHRLRHTCATERLRAGMKLEELQRFLGHADIQQTLRYAKLVNSDIHKSSERIDADFQRAIRRRAA